MANKLYVGNLSYETTESDLSSAFAEAGTVKHVALIQDRFTGKSRGFGFVTMATDEEAAKAIQTFNGREVCGRRITVTEARPKEDRPAGPRESGQYPRRSENAPSTDSGERRPRFDSPRPSSGGGGPRFTEGARPTPAGGSTNTANRPSGAVERPARQKERERDFKKPKSPGRPKPEKDNDEDFEDIDYRWRG